MKRISFFLAFAIAIISGFSFTTIDGIPAFYRSGPNCLSGITNETDCSTNNSGVQCTVNVSGNPPAWNNSDCTAALRLN